MSKLKVGILGCGAIAPAYIRNLQSHFCGVVDLVACADAVPEAAARRAEEFGLDACPPEALLADPAVELVINLTPARAHHTVNLAILRAGKHVFVEKPLALSREEGLEILKTAAERGLRVGGAADTFLGAGLQLCRRLLDEGRIGMPIAAQAIVSVGNFDSARYHDVYRGALFDLGPYYITALVALLGPIVRVASAAEIRFPRKPHPADGPHAGETFAVDFPSSLSAALTLSDGTVAALIASCDVSGYFPRVEIYGRYGTLLLNDANGYMGTVTLTTQEGTEVFNSAPGFGERGRGLGVAEMAMAIRENRVPRSSGELMYHVLDAMLAMHESSAVGRHLTLESGVQRPAPFDFASLPVPEPSMPNLR